MDARALIAAIDGMTAAATDRLPLDALLAHLCQAAVDALAIDGAGIMVVRGGKVAALVARGDQGVERVERVQDELQQGPCVSSLDAGELLVVELLDDHAARWPSFVAVAEKIGLRSAVSLPLERDGRTWAVLDLYRARRGPWSEDDLASAQMLAGLALSYIVMASERDAADEVRAELAHRAMHDDLTGLASRALLFDRLEHALRAADRTSSPVAVFFVDLDRFKEINDTFGHATGDAVLVEVAERMASSLRAGDSVARLAGDEFVVVCEDLAPFGTAALDAEVAQVERRLRRAFVAPVRVGARELAISATIGAAVSRPGLAADQLLGEADSAMYEDKHQRRSAVREVGSFGRLTNLKRRRRGSSVRGGD